MENRGEVCNRLRSGFGGEDLWSLWESSSIESGFEGMKRREKGERESANCLKAGFSWAYWLCGCCVFVYDWHCLFDCYSCLFFRFFHSIFGGDWFGHLLLSGSPYLKSAPFSTHPNTPFLITQENNLRKISVSNHRGS